MPRHLALGNGNLLLLYDQFGQVKDFYFPYVGLENHVGQDYIHKLGAWVDGTLSWIDDGKWEVKVNYQQDTLVGETTAVNQDLGIKLEFKDVVYNETNIYLRQVMVTNLFDHQRQIRLFFHQQFDILENNSGDTAYFDPRYNAVIHYRGQRVFLVNAVTEMELVAQSDQEVVPGYKSFDEYTVGAFRIEGKDGTFRDAEDGSLSKNPVEHGMVDSTISVWLDLDGGQSKAAYYWVAAAKFFEEVFELNGYVLQRTPQHLIKTTADFWKAWANRQNFIFMGLDQSVANLFKRSLLMIRTHVDNRGAIIASADSDMITSGRDTYAYMWPRDGALTSFALARAGDANAARRFFDFCNHTISHEGYFFHKYLPDFSLGSTWHPWVKDGKIELPIQEDETATIIFALGKYFSITKDLEYIETIYNSLIKKSVEWMISYRDEASGLPKPSYDLWEERWGSHTFTVASVYGAFMAAAKFAKMLGKTESEERYKKAASEVKQALLKYLYDEESGFFYKSVTLKDDGQVEVDRTVDISSAYGVFRFGVLEVDDPRLKRAFDYTKQKLNVDTEVGGLSRNDSDYYFRISQDVPGNPWFINSLWYAQYQAASAKSEEDLKPVKDWLDWAVKYTLPSGILPEQLNPYTGEALSATPLTWSHSEFINTVIDYLEKLEELGICKICNPVK